MIFTSIGKVEHSACIYIAEVWGVVALDGVQVGARFLLTYWILQNYKHQNYHAMKKLLLLFATLFVVSLSSCSKDEISVSLVGTVWSEIDGTVKKSIEFTSETRATYTLSSTAITYSSTFSYNYDYEDPYIYFTALDDGMANLKGKRSDSTMIITNVSSDENIAYLTLEE